jgi:hypothetical protein
MFASSAADIAVLIGAVSAAMTVLIGAIVSLIAALSAAKQVKETAAVLPQIVASVAAVHDGVTGVKAELVTLNGLTVGQMTDLGETRRIDNIPVDERTKMETRHIAIVPIPDDADPPELASPHTGEPVAEAPETPPGPLLVKPAADPPK